MFSGLLLYLCDSFVVSGFLKKFHFLKGDSSVQLDPSVADVPLPLFSPYLFIVACVDRRHPLCDQPGPKFPASDHRPAGAGGRVAVPPAG